MSTEAVKPVESCTDCDKVRIEKQLEAEEALRASERELAKLAPQLENDLAKLQKEHELALDLAEDAAVTDLQKSSWQAEFELGKLFHETIAEVSKGSIERSRDSAKYVQTAAAAIAALYSGLLGLVFSVTDNPLPVRGVYAAVFLGLAIALATAYLAFLTKPRPPSLYAGGASQTEMQLNRTGYLTQWINATVQDRRWAIRASVLSLAIGVAFIAAPFVATSRPVAIPDPPAAPAIPAEIAAPISDDAARLFHAQLQGYEGAVTARNEAIEKASTQSTAAAADESSVNRKAFWLAVAGLLAVLLGPLIFAKLRKEGSSSTTGPNEVDTAPAAVAPAGPK
jgi:uncharacterized membrane protein HdeD (DUF308 family)